MLFTLFEFLNVGSSCVLKSQKEHAHSSPVAQKQVHLLAFPAISFQLSKKNKKLHALFHSLTAVSYTGAINCCLSNY